jgi:ribosomal protein S18 acetylase RimI-like enzyme
MVEVRAATAEDWRLLRDVRLDALRDAPDAFLSTDAEQAAPDADWRRWIARGSTFFAYLPEVDGSEPAGLVGGHQELPDTVELASLWVRPRARGQGVGEALVAAVVDWAGTRNATSVHLWLMETNQYAWLLYQRCGFSPTGERQPLPSNPDFTEIGMTRPL